MKRGADKREAVLDAYRELVEETGFQPMATKIAERAGVSYRELYELFPGLAGVRDPSIPKKPWRVRVAEEDVVPVLPVMRRSTTIAEAFAHYTLSRLERQEITRATAGSFKETFRLFASAMGRQRPVASINRAEVEDYVRGMRNLAPATVRLRIGTIRSFFRWALIEGLTVTDPTVGIRLPKLPRYLPRGLNRQQLDAVLENVADDRERLIVLLMGGEGLRAIEVARLQIADIDPDEKTMRVLGKGGYERVLPITSEVWVAIESQLAIRGRHAGHLIQSERQSYANVGDGLSEKYVARLVGNAMKRANVDASGHALRHSFATNLLKVPGANVRDVQTALGHVSLANTQRYLALTSHSDLRVFMEQNKVSA